jgi:hypothetical protein
VFENTALARRQWTGLDDEHLASIGFVNFAWNALERKFASLVWVAADWTQDVGELVVSGMGNVSLVSLFINLLKQELKEKPDRRLWEQGSGIGILFDTIRDARNDVVHTFFDMDPTSGLDGHFKGAPRKGRGGRAEIRTIAMGRGDIDDLCHAISDCVESIDDLILKIWFRRRLLAAGQPDSPQSYERTVHGWRSPPIDLTRLKVYPTMRVQKQAERRAREAANGAAQDAPPPVAGRPASDRQL